MSDKIKALADLYEQKYLDFWFKLCEHEATAYDTEALLSAAEFVRDFALSEGLDARIEDDRYVVIENRKKSCKHGIFLMAHLDTVHRIGSFGSEPVRIKGGSIYGPGVTDCRGGIAIGIMAMRLLEDVSADVRTRLLTTFDEEVDNSIYGEKEIEYIKSSACGFDCALNLEVGVENEAVVSRKGIVRAEVKIHGRAAHSGIDYFAGASAVREAAYKIACLEEASTPGGATYNCSCLKGGSVVNIVPDECVFTVDARANDELGLMNAEKFIAETVERAFVEGTVSEYNIISRRKPMVKSDASLRLLERLNAVCRENGLPMFRPVESGGGADSAYTQEAGVPTLCGMGATGEGCHTLSERADISSMKTRAESIALLMQSE